MTQMTKQVEAMLTEQKISRELIDKVLEFRKKYPVDPAAADRIVKPMMPFYGKEILEMAIAGILEGENLLLTGPKATGKNVLAENLAWIFGRPSYNVSFHVQTGSAEPTVEPGDGWYLSSPLACTNPDADYPTWAATLTKYLAKD